MIAPINFQDRVTYRMSIRHRFNRDPGDWLRLLFLLGSSVEESCNTLRLLPVLSDKLSFSMDVRSLKLVYPHACPRLLENKTAYPSFGRLRNGNEYVINRCLLIPDSFQVELTNGSVVKEYICSVSVLLTIINVNLQACAC